MANLYEAMIGGMTEQQDPAALAQAVRSRRARNALAQLSGDKILMNLGASRDAQVHDTAKTLGGDRWRRDNMANSNEQNRLQRALTQGYYDQLSRQHGQDIALRRARMAQDASQHSAMMADRAADREAKLEVARIKAEADGREFKALPSSIENQLVDISNEIGTLRRLRAAIPTVEPGRESVVPYANTAKVWLANQFGLGDVKSGEWWNDFRQRWNITRRNEAFGATLSENEKKDWEGATINPEMTTGQLTRIMDLMEKEATFRLNKKAQGLREVGIYSPKQIDYLTSVPDFEGNYGGKTSASPQPAQPGGASYIPPDQRSGGVYNAATGTWER